MRIAAARVFIREQDMGREVGDWETRFSSMTIGALQLVAADGTIGTGFFSGRPLPGSDGLQDALAVILRDLSGVDVDGYGNRTRPWAPPESADGIWGPILRLPVDQALWDLQAQARGVPLYRLLGGNEPRVRVYASGLDFHMTTDDACAFFASARDRGFTAFKLKVGFADPDAELARLSAIRIAVGPDADLIVDANEAWDAQEAIQRVTAYRDAGFDFLWIEDPCPRPDDDAHRRLAAGAPFARINRGEGLDQARKVAVLGQGGFASINLGGHFSEGLRVAWLASWQGIDVTVGNNVCSAGVHLAAGLGIRLPMEHSFLGWDALVEEPITIADGYAHAPERPGHGLRISTDFADDLVAETAF
jgi:L-alanine-DL-glutamate epimerase-like enolase superfamily enzyme